MSLKTIPISAMDGYRKDPRVQEKYFEDRAKFLLKHGEELAQMLSEPMVMDDVSRETTDWIRWFVTNAETLICKTGDKVLGIAVLFGVQPGRTTSFMAWIAPEFREGSFRNGRMIKQLFRDVLEYAFERLKVAKIETRCCIANERAINFATKAGFRAVGVARLDYQINGALYDSVIFEYLNPALEVEPIEEILHGRESQSTPAEPVSDDDGDEQFEPGEQPPESGSCDFASARDAITRLAPIGGGSG